MINKEPAPGRLIASGALKTVDAVRRFAIPTLNPNRTNEIFDKKGLKDKLKNAGKDFARASLIKLEKKNNSSEKDKERIKILRAQLGLTTK